MKIRKFECYDKKREYGGMQYMAELKVTRKEDSIYVMKPNGTEVNYYIFDEAEVHVNTIHPHTIQEWHYHTAISENLLVTKGKLLARYVDSDGKQQCFYATEGDLIEIGTSIHTFENDTDDNVSFIVFRYVCSGGNKRELIKSDKTIVVR